MAVDTYPQDLTVGDFDADGDLDLVTVGYFWDDLTYDQHIVVVLGNGSGGFVPTAVYEEEEPLAVASGDFDSDGVLDLAVGGFYGKLSVWLGTGTGSFASFQSEHIGGASSIDAEDLTGDGKLDLVVTGTPFGGYPVVGLFPGAGDGSFSLVGGYMVTGTASSAIAADLDNDTKLDVVVANGFADVVTALRNLGSGLLHGMAFYPTGGIPHALVVTDLNEDGFRDLTVTDRFGGTLHVLLGAPGGFQPAVTYAAGTNPRFHAVGDFDRNGTPDLAVPNDTNPGTVTVLLGKGDGTFLPPRVYSAGPFAEKVVVADFTGDGIEDLAVTNNSATGTVSILRGTGTGRFRAGVPHAAGSRAYGLAAADFDGDGDQDLAVTNDAATDTLRVLLNTGNGAFQELVYHAGADAEGVVAADFNQDGRPDIATVSGDFNACTLNVFLGNGDGTFQTPVAYGLGGIALALATGDLDGNGAVDIAVASQINDSVHVFLNDGTGQFQSAGEFDGGDVANAIAVADLNNDGRPDVVVSSILMTDGVVILTNDGVWPAPIGGGPGREVFSTIPTEQKSIPIAVLSNETRIDRIDHPAAEHPTHAKRLTKPIARVIRAVAARSDKSGDHMIMNWDI